jgi:hypothetical protein
MAGDVNANRRPGLHWQWPAVSEGDVAQQGQTRGILRRQSRRRSGRLLQEGQPNNDKLGEFASSLPDEIRDLVMEQFHNYGSVLGHGGLRRRSPLMRCRHDFSDQLPAPDEFCRSRQSL